MKRNYEIKVRFTKEELDELNEKVTSTGISRESYIRMILKGTTPRELPTDDIVQTNYQLQKIGTNLNQIAYKANALNLIDKDIYLENFKWLQDTIDELMIKL